MDTEHIQPQGPGLPSPYTVACVTDIVARYAKGEIDGHQATMLISWAADVSPEQATRFLSPRRESAGGK